FYRDASKWWQICDANPAFPFPNDLLDRRPVIEELLKLVSPGSHAAFGDLVAALNTIGTVHTQAPDGIPIPEGDFIASTIIMSFTAPEHRAHILDKIAERKFHFLRSFAWTDGALLAEAFTVENRPIKEDWRLLFEDLSVLPGMLEIEPDLSNLAL